MAAKAKYGDLSTARQTMKLSDAPVEVTCHGAVRIEGSAVEFFHD